MTPLRNLPQLLDRIYTGYNLALPDKDGYPGIYAPKKDVDGSWTTHCNQFIHFVCSGMGYTHFAGMTANMMVNFMSDLKNGWITVDEVVAQTHANSGVIVIAGKANSAGHGHVCFIIPGILEESSSWKRSVPKCANVGKDVFIGKKVSFAFRSDDHPQYFALGAMI